MLAAVYAQETDGGLKPDHTCLFQFVRNLRRLRFASNAAETTALLACLPVFDVDQWNTLFRRVMFRM